MFGSLPRCYDHVRTMPPSRSSTPHTMKGCSSLGRLRFAIVVGVGKSGKRSLCLMDVKEATEPAAPHYSSSKIPKNNALRVVEGARHLSPSLGERMLATQFLGRSVFLRELLPQDLKLEIDRLTREEAMKVARYLAGVVGEPHSQSDRKNSAIRFR
jgi:uncharacterized protein (DUF2252 family)